MSYSKKVLELAKKLISHWSRWDKNEEFYLNQLIQELMIKPSNRDKTEKQIIGELQEILSEKEWKNLPKIIRKTRADIVSEKVIAREESIKRTLIQDAKKRQAAEERKQKHQEEAARLEIAQLEAEKARLNAEQQFLRQQNAKKEIVESLQYDFLSTDNLFEDQYKSLLSTKEYNSLKVLFIQDWVEENCQYRPDPQQALAIGSFNGNIQLVARAGSGKTSTLVSRAIFLHKHCRVGVDKIMVLAFNRDAVEEVETRLKDILQSEEIPHVRTFHSLAYAVVHPTEDLLFDDNKNGMGKKSQALQEVIDSKIRSEESFLKIKGLMLNLFSDEWENIVTGGYNKSPEEFVKFRRGLPNSSIKGEPLKSFGEKMIADFLFENDVDYGYEWSYKWNNQTYRPDFTIPKGKNSSGKKTGLIIEYFGMIGDREYDIQAEQKKAYWSKQENYNFLELYPENIAQGKEQFENYLYGVLDFYQIPYRKLSEIEIWDKVKGRALGRFTDVVNSFIQLCRKQELSPSMLQEKIFDADDLNTNEKLFLPLVAEIYHDYIGYLKETGSEDFDGLMTRSATEIAANVTTFISKGRSGDLKRIKYFMLDEYQDFSRQFHQQIEAIKKVNPQAEFFCVGDDWQAINGFAGSDLTYFQNFNDFFDNSSILNLSNNYRSDSKIVKLGNTLMQELGPAARPSKKEKGSIQIAYFENLDQSPSEIDGFNYDSSTVGLLRLVKDVLARDKEVVMLLRKNSNPWHISQHLEDLDKEKPGQTEFLKMVRSQFSEELRHKINMSTAHKFKGKESQVVIIIDATKNNYPLIHSDWVYNRILGASYEKIVREERRLFYVAITRAASELIFITQKDSESPFMSELIASNTIKIINWDNLPEIKPKGESIIVHITNSYKIKEALKPYGFRFDSPSKSWWRSYPEDTENILMLLQEQGWSTDCVSEHVCVSFGDERYSVYRGKWQCLRRPTAPKNSHSQ